MTVIGTEISYPTPSTISTPARTGGGGDPAPREGMRRQTIFPSRHAAPALSMTKPSTG
jgi:hypothetical protein